MRHTFSTIAAGNVLSVDINEKQVIGLSSPEGPSLLFHLRLDLSYPSGPGDMASKCRN